MDRRTFLKTVPALAVLASAKTSFAADGGTTINPVTDANAIPKPVPLNLSPIVLVKPEKDGGKSVMAALWERKTNRNVSDKKLPPQELSNLLWAAFGINRPDGGGRTAATASNSQEIDLYVVLPEGIYLYEAAGHKLTPVAEGDYRGTVGRRRGGRMASAPAILVFVADIAKYSRARFQEPGLKDPEIQKSYYNVATGLIAGNVYLFAASQGLAAWFHNCNKTGLTETLKLRPEQRVLYAQTVGYPA
jgi:hypothetical protein